MTDEQAHARGVTRTLCEHAATLRFDALPRELVELVKHCLLDAIGVILGATGLAPESMILANYVREAGGRAESTLLGFGDRVPAQSAAFVNGSLGHMLDYDDVSAGGHVGMATIPVVLALAERNGPMDGKEVIAAIAAGIDVHTRIHQAIRIPDWTMSEGWFATQLIGFLSGTAAGCRALGLDADVLENALGIAFTQCSGSRQMAADEATHLRSMQAGFSGQGAILATKLAERGIIGSKAVLEGRFGFYRTYVRGEPDWTALIDRLGKYFPVLDHHGFKIWPGCAYTRPTNAAVSRLRDRHGLRAADVRTMTVIGGSATTRMLCEPPDMKRRPRRAVDAQYSIPYTAAVMLRNGNVTLHDFTDAALADEETGRLADLISYRAGAGAATAGTSSDFSRPVVEVELLDGRVVREVASDGVPGDARNRVGWNVLERKFRDCASFSRIPMTPAALDRVIAVVHTLEEQKNVADLAAIMHPR